MAYVYGKLKEAILGGTGDKVAKDMSPNMIKALYISNDCILVIYHTRHYRIINMDINQVSEELGNNAARRESLNNVLMKYKLGCLEEIYANSAYEYIQGSNRQGGYLDVKRYADSLDRSRLRSFGLFSYTSRDALIAVGEVYEQTRMNHEYLFRGAFDSRVSSLMTIRVDFPDGRNPDWYKHHDLRPNDYPIDVSLAKYFGTVDAYIEGELKKQQDALEKQGKAELLRTMYDYERRTINNYKVYLSVKGLCRSCGGFGDGLLKDFYGYTNEKIQKMKYYTNVSESIEDSKLGKDFTTFVANTCEKFAKSENLSSQMMSSVSVEDLINRVKSGDYVYCAKSVCYEKMKGLAKTRDKELLMGLVCVMREKGFNAKPNNESALTIVDEIFADANWFIVVNSILLGLLGFGGNNDLAYYVNNIVSKFDIDKEG